MFSTVITNEATAGVYSLWHSARDKSIETKKWKKPLDSVELIAKGQRRQNQWLIKIAWLAKLLWEC